MALAVERRKLADWAGVPSQSSRRHTRSLQASGPVGVDDHGGATQSVWIRAGRVADGQERITSQKSDDVDAADPKHLRSGWRWARRSAWRIPMRRDSAHGHLNPPNTSLMCTRSWDSHSCRIGRSAFNSFVAYACDVVIVSLPTLNRAIGVGRLCILRRG